MGTNRHVLEISQRLSLRAPQQESLSILADVLEKVPARRSDGPLDASLAAVQSVCASVESFEREFPSLCFALATGVGKTRLMGAFIAYLHRVKGVRHFFLLAPNLTLYDKLQRDFDPAYDRYVLTGLGEFAQKRPRVITGDTYERQTTARYLPGGVQQSLGYDETDINIFNIGKISAEMTSGKEPRIKRLSEYIGVSYFEYLRSLPDLVLIMDESHRYRAKRGMEVLNELRPALGIELTATPFVEGSKGVVAFRNVAYSYPLSRAIADGFVKQPVALTRLDFKTENYTAAELERLKLEDAIRVHESVKVELDLYAREEKRPRVKPFVLVVAQNVEHAESLRKLIESTSFYGGQYAGKVIRVDSSQKGDEKDETVSRLLKVEDPDEPTEIVIHVNMLKEGWDVRNLYVIAPLRAANAQQLVEQTVGRGLRLPYGELTGRDALDRLTIVAHDRFQELIDEAGKPDSLIRGGLVIGRDIPEAGLQVIEVPPTFVGTLTGATTVTVTGAQGVQAALPLPVGAGVVHAPASGVPEKVQRATLDVIRNASNNPTLFPTVSALTGAEGMAKLLEHVEVKVGAGQLMTAPQRAELSEQVALVVKEFASKIIGVPKIRVLPSGEVANGYRDFDLDVSNIHYQSVDEAMLYKYLHDQEKQEVVWIDDSGVREATLDDEIVKRLIDYDDIDYMTTRDLLYKLAGQVSARLRSIHGDDEAMVYRVGRYHLATIAKLIHAQMQDHYWEKPLRYETFVDSGFRYPEVASYKAPAGESVRPFRETVTEKGEIRSMVFGGFAKCSYPVQKFDSDTERRFAVLLEDDPAVLRWMKPARRMFSIVYRGRQEYEPDFVIETETAKYLLEIKRGDQMDDATVQAKRNAAVEWCQEATHYGAELDGKAWWFVQVPDGAVQANRTLGGLAGEYVVKAVAGGDDT